jgi:hypothetical protein
MGKRRALRAVRTQTVDVDTARSALHGRHGRLAVENSREGHGKL